MTSLPRSLTEAELEALPAEDVLRWAAEEFSERLCLSCSWQKQSSVLVHMVSELGLDVDFVELDTHLFFKESYETRERLVERYGITLIVPEVMTIAEQHKREGPNLWETNPDHCCHIRKVEPLIRLLEPYDAWVSGIRREQAPSRANARKVERSERYGVWKVQPLADWGEKDVWQYIVRNDIPYNPLHDVGYRSIGCIPCTRPTRPDEEERAGRWAGSDKLECGIHVESKDSQEESSLTEHIYAHDHPESDRARGGGFTLWFTGLSGSGKSTIAHLVGPALDERGHIVEYLDGDTVRTHLSKGLGFSKEDRDTNIERIGWVASRVTRHGGTAITAAISPYVETRQRTREMVERFGPFVEVYVKASVEECARRDVNGLYAKAFAGEIKGFTGVDDPYEEPESPEIVVDTETQTPEESAQIVVERLEELGLVGAEVRA